ncbi:cyclic diguanylate phosphodiesterase [Enterobacter hormaechei]|nr:cyclic diguanylate phosphodiesterase [Enterobacter hormaechei]
MSKRKGWILYIVAGVVYVLVLSVIYISWNSNEDSESEQEAYNIINSINGILGRNASIAKLASNFIDQPCTPEVIRQLSHYAASNDSLRAVSIIKDNKWYCSSLDGTGPVNISLKEDSNSLYIDAVERNNVKLYIVFYPFEKGKIAVALYQSSLDKMIKRISAETHSDIKASLAPLQGINVRASSEYPFWIQVSRKKTFTDFLYSQYITIILATLFMTSLCGYNYIYTRQSPLLSIKRAMNNNEMIPYYQAIVDINTRKLIGAEVLVRWKHPQQGLIPPNEFIPTAEKNGLITILTVDLMKKVIVDIKSLKRKTEGPFHISINVAPQSLLERSFVSECINFREQMTELGVAISIEITERQQNMIAEEIYKQLAENKIAISLDDFGTGYSNYETISRAKPAYLKIDKMFVDSIGTDSINELILKNIITFSKGIKIPNIAEGIENEIQHEMLKSMGVKFGQGYYYGKPVPFENFQQMKI